jgi:hypothetical protein
VVTLDQLYSLRVQLKLEAVPSKFARDQHVSSSTRGSLLVAGCHRWLGAANGGREVVGEIWRIFHNVAAG